MARTEENCVVAPREGRWIARPGKPYPFKQPLSVLYGLILFPIVFLPALLSASGQVAYAAIATYVVVVAVFATVTWLRMRNTLRLSEDDRRLTDYAFGDQYVVTIEIYVGGRSIGTDRGVVWFSEGLMGFSGQATAFVLAARDVEYQPTGRLATLDEPAIPAGAIELVNAPRPTIIQFQPLGAGIADLYKRLRKFERETAAAEAERVWPPFTPYSEAPLIEQAVQR